MFRGAAVLQHCGRCNKTVVVVVVVLWSWWLWLWRGHNDTTHGQFKPPIKPNRTTNRSFWQFCLKQGEL